MTTVPPPSSASGPVSSNRVVDRAVAAIEAIIAERGLTPGARLPSERAMVAMIGTSRGSLREAIGRLSAAGRLSVGPRGTTIAAPLAARWAEGTIAAPLGARIAADPGYGRDVLEVRQGLERQAAFHAARRALPADRDHIRRCFDAMIDSHGSGDAGDEAQADAAFHLAIARASHNAVLHSVMSSMFGLLRSSISDSLEKLYTVPRTFEQLSDQHRRLMETILAGDAEAARDASDAHIQFVETTIRGIDEERARQVRAAALHAPSIPQDRQKSRS